MTYAIYDNFGNKVAGTPIASLDFLMGYIVRHFEDWTIEPHFNSETVFDLYAKWKESVVDEFYFYELRPTATKDEGD